MANERSSTTTSSMDVSDSPATRIKLGRDVMDRSNPSQPAIAGGSTLPKETAGSTTMSGMAVGSQLPKPTAKPVDFKTITGSYAGDHRAPNTGAGITDQFKNAPAPRQPARQFVGSKNETDPGFQSTVDTTEIGG